MNPKLPYRIPNTILLQKIDGESILLDSNSNQFFALNPIGEQIWELLTQSKEPAAILEALQQLYDAPQEVLKNDISTFLNVLVDRGLLIKES
jgi:hypothetical protein